MTVSPQIILNARDKQLVTVEAVEGLDPAVERVLLEVLDNPLESPLDLAHFSELGKLDTILAKQIVIPRPAGQLKQRPDLAVFLKEKVEIF